MIGGSGINCFDTSLLQEALKNSTINSDALKVINAMKKQKLNKVHSYVITPPCGSAGRWQTYIKLENGKRKKVSAMSEDVLLDKLYNYYFATATTLKALYPEWLERRENENVSSRTIVRNEQHWKKYYENSKLVNLSLSKIKMTDIEDFLYDSMKKHPMSVKTLNNMRFIVKDMLRFACRKDLISDNPYDGVEVKTTACIPESHKNDSSRVYNKEEIEKLFSAITSELSEFPGNTDSYAVLVIFKLGLRLGEVCALKFSDIDYSSREIHIHRMQTLDTDSNGKQYPIIVEHTKKKSPYGDRYLPLGDYELELFKKVESINARYGYQDNDFIFCDAEGRTKASEIDCRIRKLCRKAGIDVKSAHSIRRTVASEMHKNGISLEMIRQFLGHSTIEVTQGYIYNNNTKNENSKLIQNALCNLNNTAC